MSAHGHKSDIEPVITDPTYEDRDLNLKALGVFGIVVLITVVLTFLAMFAMFNVLNNSAADRVGEAPARVIPESGPILQAFPVAELKKYQEKQDAYSKSFSWVDKTNQVVAIPLDLAMKIAHQTEFGADMSKLDLAHLPGAVPHGPEHGDKHEDHKDDDGHKTEDHGTEDHGKEDPAEKPATAPKVESKPATESKPAEEKKPAAEEKKPASEPARPAVEEKKPVEPAVVEPVEPAKKMTAGEMEKELRILLKSEDSLIESLGEKHPKVLALRDQIKALKAQMKKAVSAPAKAEPVKPKAPKAESIKDLLGE